MSIPSPLAGLLVTVLLAAATLCAVSLWRRRGRHDRAAAAAEANHVVMGLGMAAMVLPATMGLVPPTAGAVAFAALGAVWGARLLVLRYRGRPLGSAVGGDRCGAHPTHLLLSNAAMAVMYVIMVPAGGMAGMDHGTGGHAGHGGGAAAGVPLALSAVAAALALYLIVHTAVTVTVLVRLRAPALVTVGSGSTGGSTGGSTAGSTGGSAGAGTGSAGFGGALGRAVDTPTVQLGCQAVSGAAMALMLLVH